ncbi:PstS family phosphate ABC transporter substrate-binding protein [Methylicorpusculum sp.]|uniref:PstS family phosphate ABC transporter substrate-binding protein n=1 Tax=Methylicorpusculum sp. TaxID=2713644 RepID=UPI0027315745|nr:PstS family phosphate ABC transporter substrate-binding protein [Methylicorpusculum sp.]MDP2180038.1 PstS family phosphate ABC transporter substrate-binding protein [Methylicorpusculum sp.]MDP3530418.1 PstS family phosphate ABC transporter substrate-binding protein [Methylicorpusculum sp.]
MNIKLKSVAVVLPLMLSSAVWAQSSRDYINIVGSSTVYPFSTVVAEQFGKSSKFKSPKVESTGTGGGFKLFCSGVGVQYPDITNASRAIKASEFESCQKNGVKDIVEVKVGYDGIAIAQATTGTPFALSLKELFLALAKKVPDPKGGDQLVNNPYNNWVQINPLLPATKIEVLGPPPTSGTRDAFLELAMEGGCKDFHWIKALKDKDENAYKEICHAIREDGGYIEAGENDNLIVQKLEANPKAIGIFGYSFLDQNADKVVGLKIQGVFPEYDAIASGQYPISRPMYFYVKKAHVEVIPGIKAFLEEFTSEKAWGSEGYLTDKGLIAMPDAERKQFADDVKNLKLLKL